MWFLRASVVRWSSSAISLVERPCSSSRSTSFWRGVRCGSAGPGASPDDASAAASTIDPATLSTLPDEVRDGIVTAYADALAPVFWYLIPFVVVALILSLFLKQIPLSDQAGLVARGEAISGEEAERLEAEQRAGTAAPASAAPPRG